MQKFIIDGGIKEGTSLSIRGQDARHISRVLRLKPGDGLSITDGRGMDARGQILEIGTDNILVRVGEVVPSHTESGRHITLCTAMLKHKKMDGIIKQAVQLGITQWIPFFSKRSVPLSSPKKEARQMERWQTIARESLKQCRRSRLVDIQPPMDFGAVLDLAGGTAHKIAFWEDAARPLSLLSERDAGKVMILIGPEGGFDPDEIRKARDAGFSAYSLGPRILRAETAAVCAAGLVQYLLGDMA